MSQTWEEKNEVEMDYEGNVRNSDYDSFIDSLPPSLRLKVVQAHAKAEEAPTGGQARPRVRRSTPAQTGTEAPSWWVQAIVTVLVAPLFVLLWLTVQAGRLAHVVLENLSEYLERNVYNEN